MPRKNKIDEGSAAVIGVTKSSVSENTQKDEELFNALKKSRRKKRRKTAFLLLFLAIALAVGYFYALPLLRQRVSDTFASSEPEVLCYEAGLGSVSTTVSSSGALETVGEEEICVPEGVEIEEVTVSSGESVKAGEPLANAVMTSVLNALADTQKALDDLDKKIDKAEDDTVNSNITAGVQGRLKKLYASNGQNVVDCMTENGALALISLDGHMAVRFSTDDIITGKLNVISNGKTYDGTVESCANGECVVTLTDNGPIFGTMATVTDAVGTTLGTGTLYIHNPLSVTGYAGKINYTYASENQLVYSSSTIFSLTETKYSANYDALLESRRENEKILSQLIEIMRSGVISAPFDGTVSSVDWEKGKEPINTPDGYKLLTLAPDESMSVKVEIDESEILSLSIGQSAEVTVNSISDEVYPGTVTEINRVADSSSGVTKYSAVITVEKDEKMLSGMTADVKIAINGVDNAVLIPLDALHRTSTGAFVYTGYNAELREYTDRREVVPGISGSEFVEIRSGLAAGEKVYYTEKKLDETLAMLQSIAAGE